MGMREKLIKLLGNNANCIELGIEGCEECRYGRVEDCYSHALVDHLIANDVVQVVRCKDCVWYDTGSYDAYCSHLPDGMSYPKEDDFCSCGERRNDG